MNKFLSVIVLFGIILPVFSQEDLLSNLPPEIRSSVMESLDQTEERDQDFTPSPIPSARKATYDSYGSVRPEIFGTNFFNNVENSYPLELKTAPSDYILGPGDILNINFSGVIKKSKRVTINREGQIFLSEIGDINLSGLTYLDAQNELIRTAKAYLIGTDISITLTRLRPIQLYIVGNAVSPGSFMINALSSVSNALVAAGGPSEIGSMRNISLKRSNQIISNIDLYDLLILGNSSSNVKVQSGDVLLINPSMRQISIFGAVRRPGIYELKDDEDLRDILRFASGSDANADLSRVTFVRSSLSQTQESLAETSLAELLKTDLKDGDQIFIHSTRTANLDANYNKDFTIEIRGAFKKPGTYSFKRGERILSLIERAGGYNENAYVQGGIFTRKEVALREKASLLKAADTLEDGLVSALTSGQLSEISDPGLALNVLGQFLLRLRNAEPIGRIVTQFELDKIKKIDSLNFLLHDKDSIFMPEMKTSVTVTGEVLSPMTFTYVESFTSRDYINLAGGYNENADIKNTFIVLPNGQAVLPNNGWFTSDDFVKPGSTIIATRDTTRLSQLALWKAILPIFSNLVQTLAAIDALSD